MSGAKNKSESWDVHSMILNARSLQRVAKDLGRHMDDSHSDPLLFEGKFVAIPVLLALATEIALKAWQCRERKTRPDRSHDLLELFDGLSRETQTRFEEKLPEVPCPIPGSPPTKPGIRTTLDFHRKIFEQWRYLYEGQGKKFQIAEMNNVLTAIINTYEESRYEQKN